MNDIVPPLVSIGVPTFNRPDELDKALACIVAQTFSNIEIIISDNFSPGTCVEQVVEKYSLNDPRIRFFKQKENIGAASNFEFVLTNARGKYFIWMADDDICEPEMLAYMVTAMESNSKAVLCGCDTQVVDANNIPLRVERLKNISGKKWKQARKKFFSLPISNIFYVIYGLYLTDILKKGDLKLQPSWGKYMMGAEIPFLAKVALKGEVINVPKTLKFYKSHSDSLYVKEVASISFLQMFLLKQAIRKKLLKIIFSSNLEIQAKLVLFVQVVWSAIWGFIRGAISKIMPNKIKMAVKKRLHI